MNNKLKPKLLILLGMHRSGTSLLAKAVESFGYSLGDNLMLSGDDNPRGFWEDQDIVSFNDKLLNYADSSWNYPSLLFDSQRQDLLSDFLEEGKFILKTKMNKVEKLVIKDPRFSILLPFWLKVFEQLSIDVMFILAFRNPLDVASSLKVRDGIEPVDSLQLWSFYNYSILKYISANHLVVDYNKMLSDGVHQMERIAEFIGQKGNESSDSRKVFLKNFVDNSLCHSHSDFKEIEGSFKPNSTVYALSKTLYELSDDTSQTNILDFRPPEKTFKKEWKKYSSIHSYYYSCYRKVLKEREEKQKQLVLNDIAIKDLRQFITNVVESTCDYYFIDLFFRLVTKEIFDIQLYGAGEGGHKFAKLIELSGLPFIIHSVLDKKAKNEKIKFAKVQVTPPEEMLDSVPNIVIASKAFNLEIAEELTKIIKDKKMKGINLHY